MKLILKAFLLRGVPASLFLYIVSIPESLMFNLTVELILGFCVLVTVAAYLFDKTIIQRKD